MMTILVSAETVLLVLLVVLVAGLLRSHAEILRRLGPARSLGPEHAPERFGHTPVSGRDRPAEQGSSRGPVAEPAPALSGVTPGGDAVALAFEGPQPVPTLLAFLTTGCTACLPFWDGLSVAALPAAVQTVIVTRGAERERPARIAELASGAPPVIMSSPAWDDFAVPGAPYFVLVDGAIRGEGVASSPAALASLVADALQDAGFEQTSAGRGGDVDAVFRAAGIGPEDPSLYPAGRP